MKALTAGLRPDPRHRRRAGAGAHREMRADPEGGMATAGRTGAHARQQGLEDRPREDHQRLLRGLCPRREERQEGGLLPPEDLAGRDRTAVAAARDGEGCACGIRWCALLHWSLVLGAAAVVARHLCHCRRAPAGAATWRWRSCCCACCGAASAAATRASRSSCAGRARPGPTCRPCCSGASRATSATTRWAPGWCWRCWPAWPAWR